MRLAYVVVAYRSAPYLAACLDSIEQDRDPDSQVVVVDNASPDDSRGVALAHATRPRLVSSPVNGGFGSGCNLGAAATAAEFLWFVNPDARLVQGATARLLARLDRDPRLGAAGPLVMDPSGQSRAVEAGGEPGLRSIIGHFLLAGRVPVLRRAFPPMYLARGDIAAEPDWVSGAAMMVRRIAFEDVGGFDRRLFMYMEDVDICRRMREAGWRIAYEPAAQVSHAMGGSQASGQATRWYSALHAYLLSRRGPIVATLGSLIAAMGLGIRAVAGSRSRPEHSKRMAEAARVALSCALEIRLRRDD